MGYLLLIVALSFNAAGNIMLKIGSGRLSELEGLELAAKLPVLLKNYQLILGLSLFALNVLVYAAALRQINLSIAYPIMMTGSLAIVSLFSILYLREGITLLQMVGLLVIASGIVMLTYRSV